MRRDPVTAPSERPAAGGQKILTPARTTACAAGYGKQAGRFSGTDVRNRSANIAGPAIAMMNARERQ